MPSSIRRRISTRNTLTRVEVTNRSRTRADGRMKPSVASVLQGAEAPYQSDPPPSVARPHRRRLSLRCDILRWQCDGRLPVQSRKHPLLPLRLCHSIDLTFVLLAELSIHITEAPR